MGFGVREKLAETEVIAVMQQLKATRTHKQCGRTQAGTRLAR